MKAQWMFALSLLVGLLSPALSRADVKDYETLSRAQLISALANRADYIAKLFYSLQATFPGAHQSMWQSAQQNGAVYQPFLKDIAQTRGIVLSYRDGQSQQNVQAEVFTYPAQLMVSTNNSLRELNETLALQQRFKTQISPAYWKTIVTGYVYIEFLRGRYLYTGAEMPLQLNSQQHLYMIKNVGELHDKLQDLMELMAVLRIHDVLVSEFPFEQEFAFHYPDQIDLYSAAPSTKISNYFVPFYAELIGPQALGGAAASQPSDLELISQLEQKYPELRNSPELNRIVAQIRAQQQAQGSQQGGNTAKQLPAPQQGQTEQNGEQGQQPAEEPEYINDNPRLVRLILRLESIVNSNDLSFTDELSILLTAMNDQLGEQVDAHVQLKKATALINELISVGGSIKTDTLRAQLTKLLSDLRPNLAPLSSNPPSTEGWQWDPKDGLKRSEEAIRREKSEGEEDASIADDRSYFEVIG